MSFCVHAFVMTGCHEDCGSVGLLLVRYVSVGSSIRNSVDVLFICGRDKPCITSPRLSIPYLNTLEMQESTVNYDLEGTFRVESWKIQLP